MTSSLTPGIVENSWYTSRIWMRRDGRALERRQQHAPQRVAEGDAVARLERPGLVLGVRAGFLDGLDLRGLEFDHERAAYLE